MEGGDNKLHKNTMRMLLLGIDVVE